MDMSPKPIMFCHYGESAYLSYTLKQVKFKNPKNRIVLLGDEKNKPIAEFNNVEHYLFEDYRNSAEIHHFEKVYQHVAGKNHGREFWTKFVFKRWFHIYEFLKSERISTFWHFDSDNMILTDLNEQEYKFQNYDCTEQCNGMCMNGYISDLAIVESYLRKINLLFEDEDYLNQQKEDFIENSNYAFTEMRAYKAFKDQENIKSIRLNKIIGNETFDDCICQQHGYERYEQPLKGQYLKKIYLDANNDFYCYHLESSTFIKMNSLNLSWVPISLFRLIDQTSIRAYKNNYQFKKDEFQVLDISFLAKNKNFKWPVIKFVPSLAKHYIKTIAKKISF